MYDVSSAASSYGPKTSYGCYAGKEASRAIAKFSFDEEDLGCCDIDDLSTKEQASLDKWINKFRNSRGFPVIGKVSIPPSNLELTRSELLSYRGNQLVPSHRVDAPIYVCINRRVYDVSYGGKEMYSEGNSHFVLAGHVISLELAKTYFKDEIGTETENKANIPDLADTAGVERCLLKVEEFFSKEYPCVGRLVP